MSSKIYVGVVKRQLMFSHWLRFGLIDENTFVGSEDRDTPSWFQFFNKELVRMASFSDHEAFDHPVACKIFALVLFLCHSVKFYLTNFLVSVDNLLLTFSSIFLLQNDIFSDIIISLLKLTCRSFSCFFKRWTSNEQICWSF